MTKLLTFIILLISNLSFSQLKAVIINSESQKNISYVNIWVENENIGTTSNEDGEFELKVNNTKTILFSAIGFESKRIVSDSIKNFIELKPLITQLNEVVIKSKKLTEELKIGTIKKSEINSYFGSGLKPWIIARYFNYREYYNKTNYLNKISLLTNSDVKDSKFNIRLYTVNDNGEPGEYIYAENIIGIARKGKKLTEIDISDLNIEFPKKGFFIAVEWLIIESNKHEYEYTIIDSKKKLKGISYEPAIGTVPTESDENSWILNQGRWKKIWKSNEDYKLLVIELTLTN